MTGPPPSFPAAGCPGPAPARQRLCPPSRSRDSPLSNSQITLCFDTSENTRFRPRRSESRCARQLDVPRSELERVAWPPRIARTKGWGGEYICETLLQSIVILFPKRISSTFDDFSPSREDDSWDGRNNNVIATFTDISNYVFTFQPYYSDLLTVTAPTALGRRTLVGSTPRAAVAPTTTARARYHSRLRPHPANCVRNRKTTSSSSGAGGRPPDTPGGRERRSAGDTATRLASTRGGGALIVRDNSCPVGIAHRLSAVAVVSLPWSGANAVTSVASGSSGERR